MKRTEMERKERDLRKSEKKQTKSSSGKEGSVNDYIDQLFAILRYDENEIFNTVDDITILELFESMKDDLPESQWDNVIKKAVRKTKVAEREKAISILNELLKL